MDNLERLRQYLIKASFACDTDRYSALECVSEIEQNRADLVAFLRGPEAIPPVPETCPNDTFENAIRQYGVGAACEWFGHESDSEFTANTVVTLAGYSRQCSTQK